MSTSKRQRQKAGRQARLEAARIAQQRARRNRTIRNVAIAIVALIAAAFLFSVIGGDDEETASESTTTTTSGEPEAYAYGTGPCPATAGTSAQTLTFPDAPSECIDPTKSYKAIFHTSEGDVLVDLDTSQTPGTVNNFVTLARYHYYENTQLFRTDTSIGVIQGGSPTTNSASDPGAGYTIADEGGAFTFTDPSFPQGKGPFTYSAGDLVMARSAGPDSSGAQFFFGVNDNVANLDSQGTYIRFGHVSAGLDVLEAILALNVDDPASGLGGAPSRPVIVTSIEIQESPAS